MATKKTKAKTSPKKALPKASARKAPAAKEAPTKVAPQAAGTKRMTTERAGRIGSEVLRLAGRGAGVTMREIEEKISQKHALSDDQQRKIVRDLVDAGKLRMQGARARTVYKA